MIAAVVRGGRSKSFKDTLDYVLHDKGAKTTERVGDIQTVNLASDPYQAHHEMQARADAGRAIQARARSERGERAGASGSKAENTCFHYALSWHADDQPTRAHMFATARDTLKLLGLENHQVVMVQHLDKASHAHLHIVVSAVDPDTGRTRGLWHDGYLLDRWANKYEKDQGMQRTWNRAAKFDREHEWAKKPDKEAERKAQTAQYEKRKRELNDKQQTAKDDLAKRQEDRHKAFDKRFDEIKRAAKQEKDKLREEHDKQLKEYWRKSEPSPRLETRPGPDMLRPVQSLNAEIMRTMKDMERTAPHLHPTNVERREEPKDQIKDPAPSAREAFAGRGEDDLKERRYGEQAILRWQQSQMDRVDDRVERAIQELQDDYEIDRRVCALEWAEHDAKFEKLHDELRREFEIPEQAQERETAKQERAGPMDVRSYVDDYMAGRRRDSAEHEQFAANYGPEIEQEFQSRAAEQDHTRESPPSDAPPLEPDPPSYEPSYYDQHEPEHHEHEPQQDHDYEYGD